MKCTGKEWDTCRVEKMGCKGCYYDDIEAGEYIRTTETIHNKYCLSNNITSIVTKELFKSIEYKLENKK